MKIHLLDFAEPKHIAGELVTPCQIKLNNAETVCMWDEQAMTEPMKFNSLRDCRRCWEKLGDGRYVYGVRERQEVSDGR